MVAGKNLLIKFDEEKLAIADYLLRRRRFMLHIMLHIVFSIAQIFWLIEIRTI